MPRGLVSATAWEAQKWAVWGAGRKPGSAWTHVLVRFDAFLVIEVSMGACDLFCHTVWCCPLAPKEVILPDSVISGLVRE